MKFLGSSNDNTKNHITIMQAGRVPKNGGQAGRVPKNGGQAGRVPKNGGQAGRVPKNGGQGAQKWRAGCPKMAGRVPRKWRAGFMTSKLTHKPYNLILL